LLAVVSAAIGLIVAVLGCCQWGKPLIPVVQRVGRGAAPVINFCLTVYYAVGTVCRSKPAEKTDKTADKACHPSGGQKKEEISREEPELPKVLPRRRQQKKSGK
jgi:hypothetical protein